nr:uncharacterized protein LOC113690802 [Coffea arabica]
MEAFQKAHIWVQLWNLPIHWITKEIGVKIGGIFEDVEDIIIPMGGSKEGRHIKLKVVINTSLPLLRGTVVKLGGQSIWVEFRYEKCPDFCYGCGLIGHSDKSCRHKSGTTRGNSKPQFGPWMRAQTKGASPKKRTEYRSDPPKDPKESMNAVAQKLLFEGEYIVHQSRGLGASRTDIDELKIVRKEREDDTVLSGKEWAQKIHDQNSNLGAAEKKVSEPTSENTTEQEGGKWVQGEVKSNLSPGPICSLTPKCPQYKQDFKQGLED